jgi:predicted amidohydrolase YtcJ
MMLKNAALAPNKIVDLKFENGVIAAVGKNLSPAVSEAIVDAEARVVLPGLHDHHLHFMAYAASLNSIDCSDPAFQSLSALASLLEPKAKESTAGLRAIGYNEGSYELIDRYWLDNISSHTPIRVQHRTGRLWIYNSAALASLAKEKTKLPIEFPHGAERNEQGELSGRFYHVDDWLRQHSTRTTPDIALASKTLASFGLTGFTDAGPDNDSETWHLLKNAQRDGCLLQRVMMMGQRDLNFSNDAFMQLGACKIYLKESALPDYDELCGLIRQQHSRPRPVAFHCVTAAELHYALAALSDCSVHHGDRIEHASICDDDAMDIIHSLGITVVSQPNFIAERGDRYLESVAIDEQPLLYRARSFVDRGIAFAGSTDAPFGNANPWLCMQAAVQRLTLKGEVINTSEKLTSLQALGLFLGDAKEPGHSQRNLAKGEQADCCLLDCKWGELLNRDLLTPPEVSATWIAGDLVFRRAFH